MFDRRLSASSEAVEQNREVEFFSASAGICEKTSNPMNYLMQPLVFADSN